MSFKVGMFNIENWHGDGNGYFITLVTDVSGDDVTYYEFDTTGRAERKGNPPEPYTFDTTDERASLYAMDKFDSIPKIEGAKFIVREEVSRWVNKQKVKALTEMFNSEMESILGGYGHIEEEFRFYIERITELDKVTQALYHLS